MNSLNCSEDKYLMSFNINIGTLLQQTLFLSNKSYMQLMVKQVYSLIANQFIFIQIVKQIFISNILLTFPLMNSIERLNQMINLILR